MRDVSRLALPKSHQGMGHDTGIQGTAHHSLTWDSQRDSSGLERGLCQSALKFQGQGDQILSWQGLSLQMFRVRKTAPPLVA